MNENINLLPESKKSSYRQKKIIRQLHIISIVLLFLVFILAVSIFLFKTQSSLPSLRREEKSLMSDINLLSNKAVKLILIRDRLKNISEIMTKRPDFEKRVNKITAVLPKYVSLDSLKVDSKGVSMTVSSNSLSSIGEVIDSMVSLSSNKDFFNKITLKELIVNENGKYTVSLDATIL